jgi:hypothetical protein
MGLHHWQCRASGDSKILCTKRKQSGKESVIEEQPLLYCLCSGLVIVLLVYIHTIILMCYNKKCSEKGALSGHVIQLSIKTLTGKFGI